MFLVCTLLFISLVGFRDITNKYNNMVDATVMISDDYGFGSGVFIADNVILTAGHVLTQPNLTVELSDGTILDANDFYIDNEEDVGFIFVDANEICISKISSNQGAVGDIVYLVGVPYYKDLKFTLTKGVLSHLDRDIWDWQDLIQTDAEGAQGSSGSPLYNLDGNIIGIVVTGPNPGGGVTLCESAKSILDAYERCKLERIE